MLASNDGGLILYQAYGNLYAMTGRKAHLLEDKQIPSVEIPACCDDDDDYNFAIKPNEPIDSLSMGDEHLNTILATESDKFIKSSVEDLVPNPKFNSSDDQLLYDEDVPEKIFSNPLFEEEIIPMKIDQYHDNAEFDLVESLRTHDSSLIISSKIDSLLYEFA
nr:hypothetical protein [Tanacetum cinerariifolium]